MVAEVALVDGKFPGGTDYPASMVCKDGLRDAFVLGIVREPLTTNFPATHNSVTCRIENELNA